MSWFGWESLGGRLTSAPAPGPTPGEKPDPPSNAGQDQGLMPGETR